MTNHDFSLQITQTSNFLIKTLGDSLRGIYLYGSYVDGGLKHKSDLDIFVVVDKSLDLNVKTILIQNLLLLSGAIDNKENKRYLEITIINQAQLANLNFPLYREFQYGEWLRNDFLNGYIPEVTIDQDLTILLRKVKQKSITLFGTEASKLLPEIPNKEFNKAITTLLPLLITEIDDDTTNVILTLCRMYYSLKTGKITSKDKAVDYILPDTPEHFKPLLIKAKSNYIEKIQSSKEINLSLTKEFALYIKKQIESSN